MGAGLAIIAILGGAVSYAIVGPTGLIGTLVTLSVGGSFTTLVAALLMPERRVPAEQLEPSVVVPRTDDRLRSPILSETPVSDPLATP